MRLEELKTEVEKLGWKLKVNSKLKRYAVSWAASHKDTVMVNSHWDDWPTIRPTWAKDTLDHIRAIKNKRFECKWDHSKIAPGKLIPCDSMGNEI